MRGCENNEKTFPYLREGSVGVFDDADRAEVVEMPSVPLEERRLLLHELDLHILFVRVDLGNSKYE